MNHVTEASRVEDFVKEWQVSVTDDAETADAGCGCGCSVLS
jgi:hypothetical protein